MQPSWVEVNSSTGKWCIVEGDDIGRMSEARHVSDIQARRRDAGLSFETEHYWYRPARTRDYVRIAIATAKAQRALLMTWNRAGVSVPMSMIKQ